MACSGCAKRRALLNRAGKNLLKYAGYNRHTGLRQGSHWVNCTRCGFDVREEDSRKEYTGVIVCKRCYDPRHPVDSVRDHNYGSAGPGGGGSGGAGTGLNLGAAQPFDRTAIDGSTDVPGGTFGGGGGGFDTDGFTDLEECSIDDQAPSSSTVSIDASTCLTCTPGATYTAIGLPTGVSIDVDTGLITGIATETGVFSVITYTHCGSQTVSASWLLTIPSFPADLGPTMNYVRLDQLTAASQEVADFSFGEDGDTELFWDVYEDEFPSASGGVDVQWYYDGDLIVDTAVSDPSIFVLPEFNSNTDRNPLVKKCLTIANPNTTTEYGTGGSTSHDIGGDDITTWTGEHRFILTTRGTGAVIRVRKNMYIHCVEPRISSNWIYLTEGGL